MVWFGMALVTCYMSFKSTNPHDSDELREKIEPWENS